PSVPIRRYAARLHGAIVKHPAPAAVLVLIVAVAEFVASDEPAVEPCGQQRAPGGAAPPDEGHHQPLLHGNRLTESRANIEAANSFPSAWASHKRSTTRPQQSFPCGRKILRQLFRGRLTPASLQGFATVPPIE